MEDDAARALERFAKALAGVADDAEPVLYRCQFCGEESPANEWGRGGNECPRCKRMYDWMIAQDSEE